MSGTAPIKILRMVKDGDVLGERIWRYVNAARGKVPETLSDEKGGREGLVTCVEAGIYLENTGEGEEEDEKRQ